MNAIDLADRRADVTRRVISDAVAALLEREHPAAISVPDVAAEAGVSVRTVYRYFPNKQSLLDHVANRAFDSLEELGAVGDDLYERPDHWVPHLWRIFARDVPGIKAQHQSPAGADMRDRRLGRNRVGVEQALRARFPDADDDDLAKLGDAVIAVTSSRMFLELHDRMGWDVDPAAAMSSWMVEALLSHYEQKGM